MIDTESLEGGIVQTELLDTVDGCAAAPEREARFERYLHPFQIGGAFLVPAEDLLEKSRLPLTRADDVPEDDVAELVAQNEGQAIGVAVGIIFAFHYPVQQAAEDHDMGKNPGLGALSFWLGCCTGIHSVIIENIEGRGQDIVGKGSHNSQQPPRNFIH